MRNHKALFGAIAASIFWLTGYGIAALLGSGLSGKTVYALIIGWWFTAYASSQFSIPLKSIIPLMIMYFCLFLVVAMTGKTWLYRDVASLGLVGTLMVGAIQSACIGSPIIFNSLFKLLKSLAYKS